MEFKTRREKNSRNKQIKEKNKSYSQETKVKLKKNQIWKLLPMIK